MIVLEFIRLLPMYKRELRLGKKRKEGRKEDDDDSSIVHIWFILIDPKTCLYPFFLPSCSTAALLSLSLSLLRTITWFIINAFYLLHFIYLYKGIEARYPQLNFTILYMAFGRACVRDGRHPTHLSHWCIFTYTPLRLWLLPVFIFKNTFGYCVTCTVCSSVH